MRWRIPARACRGATRWRCSRRSRISMIARAMVAGAPRRLSGRDGGLRQVLLQAGHELHQVAGTVPVVELRLQDFPAVAAGAGRARQGEEIGAAGDAAGGAALDRGGADLLVAEPTEELTEPRDL